MTRTAWELLRGGLAGLVFGAWWGLLLIWGGL